MRAKIFLLMIIVLMFVSCKQDEIVSNPQIIGNEKMNLMPIPKEVHLTENKFYIDEDFKLSVDGKFSKMVEVNSTRFLRRLSGRTGLFLDQDFITQDSKCDSAELKILSDGIGKAKLNIDESYSLNVSKSGIQLSANNENGVIYGLETLLQLLKSDEKGYYFQACKIQDEPRFPWRGLMIDVCRHFYPVNVIKRNIDAMLAMKMNVLHLHLSEDQGFRIESKVFPLLHEKGSDGLYFTQIQMKEIIEYASVRGIRVYPEFDMPSHSTAWFLGYPKLSSKDTTYSIERTWGIQDPAMDPTSEYTYQFLDKFIGEMSALFPDEYFHIGGDENNGNHWKANKQIQKYMKENGIKDKHELQTKFNQRILKILTKNNKKMVGWDEILQPEMPNNIVIQSWRGKEAMIEAAEKGYHAILSNGYYIDLFWDTERHYLNDPVMEGSNLSEEVENNIFGGEVTSWAEFTTTENVDSRIWPRTCAVAERLWSPRNVKSVDDMYRRLEYVSFHLEELGLTHITNREMGMRRLTNNRETNSLQNLIEVIEPIENYTRHKRAGQKKYLQQMPLTRLIDISYSDAPIARKIRKATDEYLSGNSSLYFTNNPKEFLIFELTKLSKNSKNLKPIIENSPVLWEIEQLSANLSEVAEIGLDAIKSNGKYSKNKSKKLLKKLEEMKEPIAEFELRIISAVEKLIENKVK
ncbi:MAG: family 20 glycosylhydrolase [Candidatus Marinimicrobia bacterium]|nr:family 20 glycosylhydrolase [Candidatus Neomarinimicrobiota bacterium]